VDVARWIRGLPSGLRAAAGRWRRALGGAGAASEEYEVLPGDAPRSLRSGFADPAVAERQHAAFAPLLEALRLGRPREDFAALARAVSLTGLRDPLLVEVGCGSGWNAEVLARLLDAPPRYVGIDYSSAMLVLARRSYPEHRFVQGDAARLPLRDGSADILVSGTVLMHLPDYRDAIAESRRVARRWCIFHTVPVLARRGTTLLRKKAYGRPTVEVIFNEGELRDLFSEHGLTVRDAAPSIPYDLEAVLGERTVTKTYLCEAVR
jgi:SAM-dependent methyltransferase